MKKNSNVLMLGSVPMSLDEMPLAPAMIASHVKLLGHRFSFLDINLDLFDICQRDEQKYHQCREELQNISEPLQDAILADWLNSISDKIAQADVLLINVFSHYSQGAAWRLVLEAQKYRPGLRILIGGIGSHKQLYGIASPKMHQWASNNFDCRVNDTFGWLLLHNQFIDGWQNDITLSELYAHLSDKEYDKIDTLSPDFSCMEIDRYQWDRDKFLPIIGSTGCVRRCSFCDVIKHFPTYEFVQADDLTSQIIELYQQTGIGKFIFTDSLINGSMSNFENLLRNLKQAREQKWLPENFSWSSTYIARAPSKRLDIIHDLLKDSGVDVLVIGVETGSDRIRFEMDKKFTNADLLAELEAFRKNRIKSNLLFFPAWPTETIKDFQDTLDLFSKLATYGQDDTITNITLGVSGFTVHDNTPIYDDRSKIGLELGPLDILWKCHLNPELDFWESVRRRLAQAQVAEHHGIKLFSESKFLGYLCYKLKVHGETIQDFCRLGGRSILDHQEIMITQNDNHMIRFRACNMGNHPVTITYPGGETRCGPGFTDIRFHYKKDWLPSQDLKLQIRFDPEHVARWRRLENQEFYSENGVYLDEIYLDDRDITLWGFNQVMDQQILDVSRLPPDYYVKINQRCVSIDTNLIWHIGHRRGIHVDFLMKTEPENYRHRDQIYQRLEKILSQFK